MKRTAILLLAVAVMFSAMMPCGALAAEVPSGIVWESYHYVDADGNDTNDTVIINEPQISGLRVLSEEEYYPDVSLTMRVDADSVDFAVSAAGDTAILRPENAQSVEVGVSTSSSLTYIYEGKLTSSDRVLLDDPEARAVIVQDMRMLTDDTIIVIRYDTGLMYSFAVPHDGNFRELFDFEEERGWNNASDTGSGSGSGSGSSSASDPVSPGFKTEIDGYVQYFMQKAQEAEQKDFSGIVGVANLALFVGEVMTEYDAFKQYGESATTQADKAYYENALFTVQYYLTAGTIGTVVHMGSN